MSMTSFASRVPATYIRGTVFDPANPPTTAAAMLAEAGLAGWDVRLRPLDSDARRDKETFEVIRDNPTDGGLDRLGTAGERYGVLQNEEVFGMLDHLNVTWEAAGSFKRGALVYGQVKTTDTIVVDPNGVQDVIVPNVHFYTTHDGSGAFRMGRSALRMDCLNQFNAIFGGLTDSISVRHTKTISERVKVITLAWKQNNAYFDAVSKEANALFQQSCTDKQFFGMVAALQGERPELNTKGAQTKFDNNLSLFAEAWNGAPNARIKGTRWGAYQALVEKNQWSRKTQNTTDGLENFAKAGMGLDDQTNKYRQNTLDLVRAF